MRRFAFLLAFALLSLTAFATDGYFNIRAGTTMRWIIRDGQGKVFGYCDETLVSMEGDLQNAKIEYAYGFLDPQRKSVTDGKLFEFKVAIKEGRTSAYINNISLGQLSGEYMPAGDLSSIPPGIRVGDKVPDSNLTVKVLTVFTAHNVYQDRRVVSRERVSVPAGTFDCFLVEDYETFTGSDNVKVQTWVARGQGIIRQVVYKADGSVNQIFELTNIY